MLPMTLWMAFLVPALCLLPLGGAMLWRGSLLGPPALRLLRSPQATWVCFGGALLWFLWHLSQLGEADFGQYRHLLVLLFGVVGVLAFVYVSDLLFVRGLCMWVLLVGREVLDAIYQQFPFGYAFLAGVVYVGVALALYLAAMPYQLRDAIAWLSVASTRMRAVGGLMVAVALALLFLAARQLA